MKKDIDLSGKDEMIVGPHRDSSKRLLIESFLDLLLSHEGDRIYDERMLMGTRVEVHNNECLAGN